MEAISINTFHNHQKYYLQPAISGVWKQFQNHYFSNMIRRGEPLIIGGDGRADTPGHSAKYGSYAMLDLDLMVVVDIQLVHVIKCIQVSDLWFLTYFVVQTSHFFYYYYATFSSLTSGIFCLNFQFILQMF